MYRPWESFPSRQWGYGFKLKYGEQDSLTSFFSIRSHKPYCFSEYRVCVSLMWNIWARDIWDFRAFFVFLRFWYICIYIKWDNLRMGWDPSLNTKFTYVSHPPYARGLKVTLFFLLIMGTFLFFCSAGNLGDTALTCLPSPVSLYEQFHHLLDTLKSILYFGGFWISDLVTRNL